MAQVVIAMSNLILSEGIARLVETDTSISVSRILAPGKEYPNEELQTFDSAVVLTDFMTLHNSFPGLDESAKRPLFILIDTDCGRENLVSAVLRKKISGVLLGDSSPELLIRAIKAVAKGDIWLDKQTFKNILHGINALGGEKNSLSPREKDVVLLTGKGLRNKEIAQQLNISETTVKTHLNRIFQKLNLKARSELISYAIKNYELGNNRSLMNTNH